MSREELREKVAQAIRHTYAPGSAVYLAMADAAIALVLEEAAKECEAQVGFNEYHHQCAAAIRALIDKPTPSEALSGAS